MLMLSAAVLILSTAVFVLVLSAAVLVLDCRCPLGKNHEGI
jgi:hypothetical protein